MTSRSGVDAVLRELQASSDAVPAGEARFMFTRDFDSAECWPDVPYDTAAPAAHPDGTTRLALDAVLDETARTMARRAPAALRLVNEQLQRVLLRCAADVPGGSASHRNHVGRCLLTNLHQPRQAVLVAIEAVTHESIHQLLYRTEQALGHPLCDLSPTPTFRSPWTGARLPLHSLVHASFVWFGLATMWTELARTPASAEESEHARGRIAQCLFGFVFLDDLIDSLAFPKGSVDAQALEGMRWMAATTRRAARAAEPQATLRQVAGACGEAGWPAAVATGLASSH